MPRRVIVHNHFPAARDVNAFEHALPREQEERNRSAAYAATGITRVTNDMHPDEIKSRIKQTENDIWLRGPRLPMTDPLFARLRALKKELAQQTGSGLTRGARDARQKPYIGKTGSTWELLDMNGQVVATAPSMPQLQGKLAEELRKYASVTDAQYGSGAVLWIDLPRDKYDRYGVGMRIHNAGIGKDVEVLEKSAEGGKHRVKVKVLSGANDALSKYRGYELEERGGRWSVWDPVTRKQIGAPQRSIEAARKLVDRELQAFLAAVDSRETRLSPEEIKRYIRQVEEEIWLRGPNLPANDPLHARLRSLKQLAAVDAKDGSYNVVKQDGRYRLLEGVGTSGGEWRVKGPRGYDATFTTRAVAEQQMAREADRRP